MKTKNLIKRLQKIVDKHKDCEVYIEVDFEEFKVEGVGLYFDTKSCENDRIVFNT